MARDFTHHDTISLQEVMEIGGDLLLLPHQDPLPTEEARALRVAGVIPPEASSINEAVMHVNEVALRYASERNALGHEPAWIAEKPPSVRTWVRTQYAQTEEDAFAIVNKLPYTGISYMVREGGFTEEVFRLFRIFRLQYIKQLGFLNAPIYNDYVSLRQSLSNHTRYLHSLDVGAIGMAMLHRLGLEGPWVNTTRTLLLTHDALTPAGGDSVKDVDFDALDEDRNYTWLLDRIDFAPFAEKHGIDRADLERGIKNEGLFGEILDVADKLAYVGRDLWACMHHLTAGAEHDQMGLRTLISLLERHPYVCSIWDDVQIQYGRIVFRNPNRLVAFLKVRLLMFRELYYHPSARFGEFLMSRLFVKTLYKSGELTRDMLFEMTDNDLMRTLDKAFGSGMALDACSSDLAKCDVFTTAEEGAAFMAELKRKGNVFAMMDDNRRSIKTGLGFLIATPNGPKTLAEYDPGVARELTEMATMLKMVHVYYLRGDPMLSRDVLVRLKESLAA